MDKRALTEREICTKFICDWCTVHDAIARSGGLQSPGKVKQAYVVFRDRFASDKSLRKWSPLHD